MNVRTFLQRVRANWPAAFAVFFCLSARANPPAPYNLLYGVVRDMYGTPLTSTNALIVLETPGGARVSSAVLPGYAPGVNYRLKAPMDSDSTPDLYRPDALLAQSPFKLYVVINGVTNLPIQMTGSYDTLGQPSKSARIDLTLGVDANGDGIPDQWEAAFLQSLGLNIPLSALNANSILTPDGLTLWQQFVLGTYPFDPADPCLVTFAGFHGNAPILQFPTITGRYYSLLGSSDGKSWTAVPFLFPGDNQTGPARSYYYAPAIATMTVYVPPSAGQAQFYKVSVQ